MTQKQKLLLVLIILVAGFFRLYLIFHMPGGLFPDEAANGLDINSIFRGNLQPFYERGNGREALFFYLLSISVAFFGRGAWQHHIVSATIGILSVGATFAVSRALFIAFAKNTSDKIRATNYGLWVAFFMAVSTWHIVLSRTAFRAITIPLFTALTFYCVAKIVQNIGSKNIYKWSILAGVSFGLGFYTYIAYRIMAPLLAIAIAWPLIINLWHKRDRQLIIPYIKPFLVATVSAIIILAPITNYFYTHPGSFVGRSTQVSVFNPELNNGNLIGTMAEVAKLSLVGYFKDGDLNWRHNISGLPFLPPIVSPFFGLGLLLITLTAVRYIFKPKKFSYQWPQFLLAGWFWSMLFPSITTAEGIPHGLRSIGTIPPVFMISVYGMYWLMDKLIPIVNKLYSTYGKSVYPLVRKVTLAVPVLYIISLTISAYSAYFVYASNSPENFYAFRSDLSVVSDYLVQNGDKRDTYLILDKFSIQTVDYITTPKNQPYHQVDPEHSWQLEGLKTGDKIVFTQSSIFDIDKFLQYHPQAKLSIESRDKFGSAVMAVYTIQ